MQASTNSSESNDDKVSEARSDFSIAAGNQELDQEGEKSSDEMEKEKSSLELDVKQRGAARKQHWKSQSVGDTGTANIQSTSSNLTAQEEEFQEHKTFSANRELWQRRATSQTTLAPTLNPTPKFFRSSQEFRKMRQKHTPDLVMDLPLTAEDPSKKTASTSSLSSSDEEISDNRLRAEKTPTTIGPESPDMSTAAERFAKQNQCTLKKNTKTAVDNGKGKHEDAESESETDNGEIVRSASSSQISETLPLRSPTPSRSTPKIVAKFADLHLTGGSQVPISSFKPQVKVKPTILRKPVLPYPHPHMSPELARKIEKQAQSTEHAN